MSNLNEMSDTNVEHFFSRIEILLEKQRNKKNLKIHKIQKNKQNQKNQKKGQSIGMI